MVTVGRNRTTNAENAGRAARGAEHAVLLQRCVVLKKEAQRVRRRREAPSACPAFVVHSVRYGIETPYLALIAAIAADASRLWPAALGCTPSRLMQGPNG